MNKNTFLFLSVLVLLIASSCGSMFTQKKVATFSPDVSLYALTKEKLLIYDYDSAIQLIDKAILANDDQKNLSEMIYWKGMILQSQDQYDAAIATYKTLGSLNNVNTKRLSKANELIKLAYMQMDQAKKQDSIAALPHIEKTDHVETDLQDATAQSLLNITPPIFPGCTEFAPADLKACMSSSISKHIQRRYDGSIGIIFNASNVTRTFVTWNIDENGTTTDLKAKGTNKFLAIEAMRTIISLPYITPATKDGKIIKVKYTVPITFKIED